MRVTLVYVICRKLKPREALELVEFPSEFEAELCSQVVSSIVTRLSAMIPEQQFDLAFVHKYEEGEGVPRHKDPHQQLGALILATFGDYEGGELVDSVDNVCMKKAGDMCVMRCRIPGVDRPLHEVKPVSKGTRYSLMISTLIIADVCKPTQVQWQ